MQDSEALVRFSRPTRIEDIARGLQVPGHKVQAKSFSFFRIFGFMAESNQTKLLSSSLVLILALLTRNHRSTPTVYRAKKKAPEAGGSAKGDGGDRGHMGDMGSIISFLQRRGVCPRGGVVRGFWHQADGKCKKNSLKKTLCKSINDLKECFLIVENECSVKCTKVCERLSGGAQCRR